MTQTEEIFELKEELERVKLLLQKCNGDIVRADRELKSERNKVLDEAIAYLKSREKEQYDYFLNDSEDKHAYGKYCAFTEAAEELESLKL